MPWNGTLKLASTKIFHSIGQTEMGSETIFITLILITFFFNKLCDLFK